MAFKNIVKCIRLVMSIKCGFWKILDYNLCNLEATLRPLLFSPKKLVFIKNKIVHITCLSFVFWVMIISLLCWATMILPENTLKMISSKHAKCLTFSSTMYVLIFEDWYYFRQSVLYLLCIHSVPLFFCTRPKQNWFLTNWSIFN